MSADQVKYKNLDKTTINGHDVVLYTWDHENEAVKLIESQINFARHNNWFTFIKPGSTTIDIGVHSGDTIIPLMVAGSQYFRQPTRILGIEPNPAVIPIASLNIGKNTSDMAKITMAEVAITDKDDVDVVFSDHGNGMCNGGIIHDNMSEELKNTLTGMIGQQITCKGYTLETVCKQHLTSDEIEKISFIKIDTEGYDREIVQSSVAFLNRYKPCLYIEWFLHYGEEDSLKLFEVIEDANYIPFNPVTLDRATVENYIHDLLLIHKEDSESLSKTKT
jgi:FkbM family methyltransferase